MLSGANHWHTEVLAWGTGKAYLDASGPCVIRDWFARRREEAVEERCNVSFQRILMQSEAANCADGLFLR